MSETKRNEKSSAPAGATAEAGVVSPTNQVRITV